MTKQQMAPDGGCPCHYQERKAASQRPIHVGPDEPTNEGRSDGN